MTKLIFAVAAALDIGRNQQAERLYDCNSHKTLKVPFKKEYDKFKKGK